MLERALRLNGLSNAVKEVKYRQKAYNAREGIETFNHEPNNLAVHKIRQKAYNAREGIETYICPSRGSSDANVRKHTMLERALRRTPRPG